MSADGEDLYGRPEQVTKVQRLIFSIMQIQYEIDEPWISTEEIQKQLNIGPYFIFYSPPVIYMRQWSVGLGSCRLKQLILAR